MKVSILTATYNSSETLEDCLQSIHNQTHPHIEHIIIDGGSTDGTIEVIKNFGLRIKGLRIKGWRIRKLEY